MRGVRLGYYGQRRGQGYGAFGAARAANMPSSASAAPIFVGPVIQPPLPGQRVLSPMVTPVAPASRTPPSAAIWAPQPVVAAPISQRLPPALLPPVDSTMKS